MTSTTDAPYLPYAPIEWADGVLRWIDQTRLPNAVEFRESSDYRRVVDAVKRLEIRGAPLIGIAAAYGMALAAREFPAANAREFESRIAEARRTIASARPTAVNLAWALEELDATVQPGMSPTDVATAFDRRARELHDDDARRCERIGVHGAGLLPEECSIVTHCNAGALATGGIGTAFGIILTAHRQGKRLRVFVDETRPLLQGARLTAWELERNGIPYTLIVDGAAASLMRAGDIDIAVTGADRIAANGDVANKIGTYSLAIAAWRHGLPMYVAAPVSTLDPRTPTGDGIRIEARSPDEVTTFAGMRVAPPAARALSPAFDVTPAELVSAIVTERGIFTPPYLETLPKSAAYSDVQ